MRIQSGRRMSRMQKTTAQMVAGRRLNPGKRNSGVESGPDHSRTQSPSRKHMTVMVIPMEAWDSAPRGQRAQLAVPRPY